MNIGVIVAAVLISLAIGAIVGVLYRKKIAESKVGNAEEEAKRIVNMARIEAENLKKEEIIKAKEEIMASRKELDQEIKERRGEVQRQETRLLQREENLDRRSDNFEKKELEVEKHIKELEDQKEEVKKMYDDEIVKLQQIASLSKEQAREELLQEVDKEVSAEKAEIIRTNLRILPQRVIYMYYFTTNRPYPHPYKEKSRLKGIFDIFYPALHKIHLRHVKANRGIPKPVLGKIGRGGLYYVPLLCVCYRLPAKAHIPAASGLDFYKYSCAAVHCDYIHLTAQPSVVAFQQYKALPHKILRGNILSAPSLAYPAGIRHRPILP